jgi:hypothetical protein
MAVLEDAHVVDVERLLLLLEVIEPERREPLLRRQHREVEGTKGPQTLFMSSMMPSSI